MLSFLPSRDEHTVAVKFKGKSTEEDIKNLDHYIKENFESKEKINMFAVVEDIEGTTLEALLKGTKFDLAHWKRYNKFAIISGKKWIKMSANMINVLPGINMKFFERHQIDEAWDWIKQ